MAPPKAADDGKLPGDIRTLSFEEALDGLEEIVRQLESGDVSLEDSIEIYSRGTQLKRHCEEKLRAAAEKVEKIVLGAGGKVAVEPAELD